MRHQPTSDGKVNVEAELASVERAPLVQQARRVADWAGAPVCARSNPVVAM
jgi:hypothetical protein